MAKGSAVPRSSGLVAVALFINWAAGVTDCGTNKAHWLFVELKSGKTSEQSEIIFKQMQWVVSREE